MEENKKKNPVVTVFDEESGKYYDITIDLDLLESTELGEEEKALLEALLKEAEEQKESQDESYDFRDKDAAVNRRIYKKIIRCLLHFYVLQESSFLKILCSKTTSDEEFPVFYCFKNSAIFVWIF